MDMDNASAPSTQLPMEELAHYLSESNAIEDVYDVDALTDALAAWAMLQPFQYLNANRIESVHGVLMRNLLPFPDAGRMRRCDVWIGGKRAPSAYKVHALLAAWCEKWAQDTLPLTDEDCIKAHVAFEHIHPFVDGNGRIGRLLLLWHRTRCGLDIKPFTAADKYEDYYPLFKI